MEARTLMHFKKALEDVRRELENAARLPKGLEEALLEVETLQKELQAVIRLNTFLFGPEHELTVACADTLKATEPIETRLRKYLKFYRGLSVLEDVDKY